jgi:hypothetical protein
MEHGCRQSWASRATSALGRGSGPYMYPSQGTAIVKNLSIEISALVCMSVQNVKLQTHNAQTVLQPRTGARFGAHGKQCTFGCPAASPSWRGRCVSNAFVGMSHGRSRGHQATMARVGTGTCAVTSLKTQPGDLNSPPLQPHQVMVRTQANGGCRQSGRR